MTDEEWDSLSTEQQEAHTKALFNKLRRSRNQQVLEVLKFAEAVERGRLMEMSVAHPMPRGMPEHVLTVKVIF